VISRKIFFESETKDFQPSFLHKGVWLVILHSERTPPHVGLIFSGNYFSLTIKEAEIRIPADVLLKTISQKKIKSVFLKVKEHPVFSVDHQQDIFIEQLIKFGAVKQTEATCLSPLKLFFLEFYMIQSNVSELLFDFIGQLYLNKYIEYATAINVEIKEGFELPYYTTDELNDRIAKERLAL
jgi:hypothetical protein